MKLSKKLKHLLADSDMNISQLSRATKIPRQTLDNWISGQEPRNLTQVKLVANYFDITIDELCFDQPAREVILELQDSINAGIFEVLLRRVRE